MQRPILTTAIVLCALAGYCAAGCDRRPSDTEREPERLVLSDPVGASGRTPAAMATLSQGGLPLSFVENKGQIGPAVKYVLRGPHGSVFFTPTEVVFEVFERKAVEKEADTPDQRPTDEAGRRRSVVVRVTFPGAQNHVIVEGKRELPGKINILRGSDPTKWHTDIRTFAEIVYRDLYPGIDLIFSGEKGELTRTFIVGPEGDIENVRMKYAGVESVEVTDDGAIRLKTAIGTISEHPPTVQRVTGDKTVPMRVVPQLVGESKLGFIPTSQ